MLMARRRHHACPEEQVWELGHHLDSQKLVNRFLGVLEASWFFTENLTTPYPPAVSAAACQEDTLCNECTHRVDKNKGLSSVFSPKSCGLFFIATTKHAAAVKQTQVFHKPPSVNWGLCIIARWTVGRVSSPSKGPKRPVTPSHSAAIYIHQGLTVEARAPEEKTRADERTCKVHTEPTTFVLWHAQRLIQTYELGSNVKITINIFRVSHFDSS